MRLEIILENNEDNKEIFNIINDGIFFIIGEMYSNENIPKSLKYKISNTILNKIEPVSKQLDVFRKFVYNNSKELSYKLSIDTNIFHDLVGILENIAWNIFDDYPINNSKYKEILLNEMYKANKSKEGFMARIISIEEKIIMLENYK